MAKDYHVSRRIDAPADRIWGLLTDASSYRDWNRAVVSIEGTIALGNSISLVSIANPKRVFTLKITDATRPKRLVWSDGMLFGLFKGDRTYRLDQRGGATEFSMTEQFSGLLSGLMSRVIPDLTDSFNLFADSLKSAAEVDPR